MDFDFTFRSSLLLYIGYALGFGYLAQVVLKGWRARRVYVELRRQGLVRKARYPSDAQSDEE